MGRDGDEAGGELAEVAGITVIKGAVDPADAVLVGDFDDEAGGVVVGNFFAELLVFPGGGFGVGLETADGFREIAGSDGELGGGLGGDRWVVAGGRGGGGGGGARVRGGRVGGAGGRPPRPGGAARGGGTDDRPLAPAWRCRPAGS